MAVFYDVEVDLLRQNHGGQIAERSRALKRIAARYELVECEAQRPHVRRRPKGVLASLLLLFIDGLLQQLRREVLVRTYLEFEVPFLLVVLSVWIV